jgi:hypothetical protein
MADDITPEKVRELLDVARGGDWVVDDVYCDETGEERADVYSEQYGRTRHVATGMWPEDARLIAAAPSIARAYLEQAAELERARASVTQLSAANRGAWHQAQEIVRLRAELRDANLRNYLAQADELQRLRADVPELRSALHEALDGWQAAALAHVRTRAANGLPANVPVDNRLFQLRKIAGPRSPEPPHTSEAPAPPDAEQRAGDRAAVDGDRGGAQTDAGDEGGD